MKQYEKCACEGREKKNEGLVAEQVMQNAGRETQASPVVEDESQWAGRRREV